MHQDIEKVLIDEGVIQKRLEVLAGKVMADFEGESVLVIALFKGALLFTADLLRRIPLTMERACLNVASYHGGTTSGGEVLFLDSELPDVKGRKILLLDDILDTGRTLREVTKKLSEGGTEEIRTCVLLSKDIP